MIFFRISDPGCLKTISRSKAPDPRSGSATLLFLLVVKFTRLGLYGTAHCGVPYPRTSKNQDPDQFVYPSRRQQKINSLINKNVFSILPSMKPFAKKVPHPQHFRGLPDKTSAVLPHWKAEDVRTVITQHQPKTAKPNWTIAKKVTINKFFGTFSSP